MPIPDEPPWPEKPIPKRWAMFWDDLWDWLSLRQVINSPDIQWSETQSGLQGRVNFLNVVRLKYQLKVTDASTGATAQVNVSAGFVNGIATSATALAVSNGNYVKVRVTLAYTEATGAWAVSAPTVIANATAPPNSTATTYDIPLVGPIVVTTTGGIASVTLPGADTNGSLYFGRVGNSTGYDQDYERV